VNGVDGTLASYLIAWREDSLRPPLPQARERARNAMRVAAASAARHRYRVRALSLPFGVRLRLGPALLGGAAAAVVAGVVVGLLGWNAPAGSPLYGVRAARQTIQLVLPGADLAALHMQYAEASLLDAHNDINATASLANARNELDAAQRQLPTDRSAPLWTRWEHDESQVATEESEQEREPQAPAIIPGSTSPSPRGSPDDRGAAASASPRGADHQSPEPSEGRFPSPSASGGDTSPRPSGSPHGD
jgi:hypothetical protein